MKIINKASLFFLLVVSLLFCALFPTANLVFTGKSFYQSELGLIYCTGEWECRHEVGHLMDHELNDISQTNEFGIAVATYLYYEYKYGEMNDLTNTIIGTSGLITYSDRYEPFHIAAASSPQKELYANIYALVGGDISKLPNVLAGFYKSEQKYESVYQRLLKEKYYFD